MDLQIVITIGSVFFGAGGFIMGALVTKNEVSGLKTTMEKNRREDSENMRKWVEEHFLRRHA